MFVKKTVLLLILAMGMLLGTACGPEPEEYESPARPGESPPGYEQPTTDQERPLMQPEATPESPMGQPESGREFQINEQNQGQGAPLNPRPTQ
jgi:hypothetical protein